MRPPAAHRRDRPGFGVRCFGPSATAFSTGEPAAAIRPAVSTTPRLASSAAIQFGARAFCRWIGQPAACRRGQFRPSSRPDRPPFIAACRDRRFAGPPPEFRRCHTLGAFICQEQGNARRSCVMPPGAGMPIIASQEPPAIALLIISARLQFAPGFRPGFGFRSLCRLQRWPLPAVARFRPGSFTQFHACRPFRFGLIAAVRRIRIQVYCCLPPAGKPQPPGPRRAGIAVPARPPRQPPGFRD